MLLGAGARADFATPSGETVLMAVARRLRPEASGDQLGPLRQWMLNFTRIVVNGETLPFEYLRLTVDPRATAVFSWERMPVASG